MRALFDRIANPLPQASDAEEALSRTRDSIGGELSRLLNSRSFFGTGSAHGRDSILNYGLVDLASADFHGGNRRALLANRIREAIVRYEPRLFDVQVAVYETDVKHVAEVEISAGIRDEDRGIRFVIPLNIPE